MLLRLKGSQLNFTVIPTHLCVWVEELETLQAHRRKLLGKPSLTIAPLPIAIDFDCYTVPSTCVSVETP